MVDAADPEKIEASKNELHNLLDKPQLQGIPVSKQQHAQNKKRNRTDQKQGIQKKKQKKKLLLK